MEKNILEKCKKIFNIIILIILIPILFINSVILIDSIIHPNEIPSFFGWKPFIVLSSSMEPEISSGDIAVVKEIEANNLKVNDIIAIKQDEIVIVNRIIDIVSEKGETRYITKSDNNDKAYEKNIVTEQIEGIYDFKINRLGNFAVWIQTPLGMIVSISIPLLILIILQNRRTKEEVVYIKNQSKENEDMKKELEELRKQNELLKNQNK